MAQRGIREYHAKRMLAKYWNDYFEGLPAYHGRCVLVTAQDDLAGLARQEPWLAEGKLVAKPDQLFGKRGKHGLILAGATLAETQKWIAERMDKETQVGKVSDKLTHFLVEPFTPHQEEYYVAIKSEREGDVVYFSTKGGIDIESVWDSVTEIHVPIVGGIDGIDVAARLKDVPESRRQTVAAFIKGLFRFYAALDYSYLEINPFALTDNGVIPLDTVARLDDTAFFEAGRLWGDIDFPAPFGRVLSAEERFVKGLDEKTGASLKLTVLNPKGRIWTMVAGGGASVIYTDTIIDLGGRDELANYGEYSGDPNAEITYQYARTVLDLMTREADPQGRPKILIIGGGIANFTDVAKTFSGIIRALSEAKDRLKKVNAKIYVRRGGPNYQKGLEMMRRLGESLGMPIEVYGPEAHMTTVVALGLEKRREARA
ncbi:MAG: ATP citrate lyase citrate-binding domain-containing protein [Pseudomonadota bacterium]